MSSFSTSSISPHHSTSLAFVIAQPIVPSTRPTTLSFGTHCYYCTTSGSSTTFTSRRTGHESRYYYYHPARDPFPSLSLQSSGKFHTIPGNVNFYLTRRRRSLSCVYDTKKNSSNKDDWSSRNINDHPTKIDNDKTREEQQHPFINATINKRFPFFLSSKQYNNSATLVYYFLYPLLLLVILSWTSILSPTTTFLAMVLYGFYSYIGRSFVLNDEEDENATAVKDDTTYDDYDDHDDYFLSNTMSPLKVYFAALVASLLSAGIVTPLELGGNDLPSNVYHNTFLIGFGAAVILGGVIVLSFLMTEKENMNHTKEPSANKNNNLKNAMMLHDDTLSSSIPETDEGKEENLERTLMNLWDQEFQKFVTSRSNNNNNDDDDDDDEKDLSQS